MSENGRPRGGAILAFADITEEHGREDYIRYLGRIVGRASIEIDFLDPKTLRFILANKGGETKLGCSAAHIAQLTLPDVLPDIPADAILALLRPLLSGASIRGFGRLSVYSARTDFRGATANAPAYPSPSTGGLRIASVAHSSTSIICSDSCHAARHRATACGRPRALAFSPICLNNRVLAQRAPICRMVRCTPMTQGRNGG